MPAGEKREVIVIGVDLSKFPTPLTSKAKRHAQLIAKKIISAAASALGPTASKQRDEGDSALFCIEKTSDSDKEVLSSNITSIFDAIQTIKAQLKDGCACQACSSIDDLCLKVSATSGEAFHYTVKRWNDLVGEPMWTARHLLTLGCKGKQCLFMTESAIKDLGFESMALSTHEVETATGKVKVATHLPVLTAQDSQPSFMKRITKGLSASRFFFGKRMYRNLSVNRP